MIFYFAARQIFNGFIITQLSSFLLFCGRKAVQWRRVQVDSGGQQQSAVALPIEDVAGGKQIELGTNRNGYRPCLLRPTGKGGGERKEVISAVGHQKQNDNQKKKKGKKPKK